MSRISTLIDNAYELGLKGLALTDHDTVSGYIQAENYVQKKRAENPDDQAWQDFKLILGNEIYLCRNGLNKDNYDSDKDRYYHFILLAKDKIGNDQIRRISSRAWSRSYMYFHNRVPTYWTDLEEIIQADPGHVIASTACLGGQLPQLIMAQKAVENNNEAYANYENAIHRLLSKLVTIFGEGNFYMETQPGKTEEQILVNKKIKVLSEETGIPCIVTTDTHYIHKEDRPIHAAFLNSKQGDREAADFYEATYMMTTEEIRERMSYLGDDFVNGLFANTLSIGESCERYTLKRDLSVPYLPRNEFDEELKYDFDLSESEYPYFHKFYNSETADKQLIIRLWNFMNEDEYTRNNMKTSLDSAEEELRITWDSSEKMNVRWSKYFLQMADYLKVVWTLGDSIVAPSRGSAGASFVLYALGIIQINKNREKAPLIFERFLNPDRASVLDIDSDIESDKRQRCIAALQHVYGEERVTRVATFRTETTKSVIKTAGRGLGLDLDTYTYIASLVTSHRGIDYSLNEMYYGDPEKDISPNPTFVSQMNKHPELWSAARELEGIITGIGVHAGGIIIDDRPIYETAGVMKTNQGDIITSFDLDDCEATSLIKIDDTL